MKIHDLYGNFQMIFFKNPFYLPSCQKYRNEIGGYCGYGCCQGERFAKSQSEQTEGEKKVIILDNNPLSIASYLEDHPEVELEDDAGRDE